MFSTRRACGEYPKADGWVCRNHKLMERRLHGASLLRSKLRTLGLSSRRRGNGECPRDVFIAHPLYIRYTRNHAVLDFVGNIYKGFHIHIGVGF